MNTDWHVVLAVWAVWASWRAWEYRRRWQRAIAREAKVLELLTSPRMIPVVLTELRESCRNPDCPEHGEQVRAASAKATVN